VFDMSRLALVDHEGRVLDLDKKATTPTPEVEDDPIWVIAAREAERQSTKKGTNK
jgi:hypothetical protein